MFRRIMHRGQNPKLLYVSTETAFCVGYLSERLGTDLEASVAGFICLSVRNRHNRTNSDPYKNQPEERKSNNTLIKNNADVACCTVALTTSSR